MPRGALREDLLERLTRVAKMKNLNFRKIMPRGALIEDLLERLTRVITIEV